METINNVNDDQDYSSKDLHQFVTMQIGEQSFGISVEHVVDILLPQKINSIPLSRKEVLGSLNLRGRIVTTLDIRVLLGIDDAYDISKNMCVVVEYQEELCNDPHLVDQTIV
jgi:purine-binding chemotaxis protein CheW